MSSHDNSENVDFPLKETSGSEYRHPMETQVNQLMQAAKSGDETAFGQLVEQIKGRAFIVATSMVGSREDAMDLCQDAFAKTWRARATFLDEAPFLPWFHRILRNTCFSFLRKRGRIKRSSLSAITSEDPDWDLEGTVPPPSAALELAETHKLFWQAVNQLPARDREILVLRQFEELSYREISHALEVPEGTVMSRLFHARRRLRDFLEPHLEGALSDFASPDNGAPR